MTNREALALQMCIEAHENQFDKGGKPYAFHPIRVACAFGGVADTDMVIAALLHDVVEDTEVTILDIRHQFGDDVADAVDGLSRRKKETYVEFILRCKQNPISRRVKLADIADNTRPDRISSLPESERGIVKRYAKAKTILQEVQ